MFKFDFEIDDLTDDAEFGVTPDPSAGPSNEHKVSDEDKFPPEAPSREISIEDLLDSLPSLISCSPLTIPLHGGNKNVTLTRRDLFDARFQLIAEGTGPEEINTIDATIHDEASNGEDNREEKQNRHASALQFIEAPSDLVPRVYEGGLKTWECSIDLVEYLDSTQGVGGFRGKHILELGCGTAVPTLYALHHIFSSPLPSDSSQVPETVIYLQDYNDTVLELVTFPNVLLTWYLSPASQTYRTSNAASTDPDPDVLPFPTTPEPFELPISASLKTAFLSSLKNTYNVTVHFISGSWSSFSTRLPNLHPRTFDIVLTSETIYQMDSLPSLVKTMQLARCGSQSTKSIGENCPEERGECLVAAKLLYFGVGGGVSDFVDFVEKKGVAKAKTVREKKTGIGRAILSLNFI